MTLDDLEQQNKGFIDFRFLRFRAVTRTSRVTYAEITILKPEQPAYEIFSIKRRFQQSKSQTPFQGNLRMRASNTGIL